MIRAIVGWFQHEVTVMNRFLIYLFFAVSTLGTTAGCRLVMEIPDDPEAACGNAVRESGEACDGADLGGATCDSLGFVGGTLSCAANCTLNTEPCLDSDPCGDGQVELEESCDGDDLDGQTCQSLGFHGGDLACTADCSWNLASCELAGRCGDGVIQEAHQETCDGAALGGQTCQSLGYHGGDLSCAADCSLNLASCELAGRCGDGVIQTTEGETCDGANLGGQTCAGMGYYGGTLACAADCTLLLAPCVAAGRCGDAIVQTAGGEVCDGANLDGQTCGTLGYYGGTLACNVDCTRNLASCALAGRCGDGLIQDTDGETCDGADLGGQTCYDLGYCGGTLACKPNCNFLTTGCSNEFCK